MNFKNKELIISSGGNKGIALLGALNEFSKFIPLFNFKYLTGCSIGAIIVLLLNIGYKVEELSEILFQIDFKEFQDCKLINLIQKCGLDEGVKFTNFLKAIILNKNISSNITFIELYNLTNIILTITVVNITTGKTEYHNYINTPHLSVILSVRMSANIPILFSPILFNDNYYIDGALLEPFPINYNKNTIKYGFWLFDEYEYNFINNSNNTFFVNELNNSFQYIENISRIIHINYIKEHYKKIINKYCKNIIIINFENKFLRGEDFDIKLEDKIRMYNIGLTKSLNYFKKLLKKNRKKYLSIKYFYLWKYKILKKNNF
jgi:predicted patatin/cPLA2 family phospholipase